MKKGEIYEGIIEKVDFPNKGYVNIDGEKVIVKNGIPGQKVRFMINKKRSGRAEGRLLEILENSTLEVREPVCKIFPACGGCMYQTMSYEEQLKMKETQVKGLLQEAVGIGTDLHWEGIHGSPIEFGYRNKMEFSFGDEYKDGPLSLGLHKKGSTLHSVTNYALHKALYSGHNDHNYFEIAHTVKYLQNMGDLDLYNFVDNHDVERIYTKLSNKAHFAPVHVLLYTLPGVPSIYYGSEFGIEGRKERTSDDSLRPALNLADYADAVEKNPCTALIAALGKVRQNTPALNYGSYAELMLTNRQYAFARDLDGVRVIITVNNDDNAASMDLAAGNTAEYVGTLTGEKVSVENGRIHVTVAGNSGNIWVPAGDMPEYKPVEMNAKTPETTNTTVKADNADQTKEEAAATVAEQNTTPISQALKNAANTDSIKETVATTVGNSDCTTNASEKAADGTTSNTTTASEPASEKSQITVDWSKSPEDMTVEELQAGILAKMANNGPVTDQMKKTVYDNIWHDSLVNWLKSFR